MRYLPSPLADLRRPVLRSGPSITRRVVQLPEPSAVTPQHLAVIEGIILRALEYEVQAQPPHALRLMEFFLSRDDRAALQEALAHETVQGGLVAPQCSLY